MDIHMAARHGRIDRVRLLLDKKVAAVNQPDKNYGGATPLHWASLQGHERVVRLLCERGADPNGKAGNPSASPLHWAARAGQVKALKTLREFGGNPRLPDGQGYNCLHLAVQGNHPKMVQHLLSDAKMDVDGEDPMGRTPLIWACYLGSSSDVIDVLLKYKARINLPDALKFTPLHWAVGTAHYDVAKQLLLAGADREAKDRDGKTPGDRARDLGTGATYEATLRVVANRRERALSQSSASPTPAMIAAQAAKPVEAMPLRHFKLYNGVNVPCIGLGTAWSHAMDSEKVAVTLSTAIELGYRHIDSAQVYHNEKHVGDAMAAIYAKGQITREMIFHSSKAWNTHHRPQNLRAALLQTLKDLRYTYLDAYYLHWPISFLGPPDVQKDVPRGPLGEIWLDSEVNLEDTWREMEKFVDEGLVRAIGVCNFPLHQFKWLLEIARIKPAVHQFETHPYLPQPELLSYCRKHDIVVMAYAPLGITALLEDATVQQIARQYGVPPAKILVSRAIQRGTCVVLRSADARHMAENLQLIKLDQDDLETLGTLKVRKRFISPLELFGVDLFGESDKGYEDVGGAKGVALGGGGAHLVI